MGSVELYQQAKECIPGGVNSPARACRAVGIVPPFIKSAKGSKIYDVEGNEYIDYVCSWGPMILGHVHPNVLQAVQQAAAEGFSFGAPTEKEVVIAQMIREAVPSMEMVRLVSSGTEAVMSALRLARGYTGKEYIIKFAGCYHGHSDSMLVKAGSGLMDAGIPDSAGVPMKTASSTLTAQFNDKASVETLFAEFGNEIAAVVIEPVAGNMGVVAAEEGFLEFLREITTKHNALLIFDEVITGFRVSYGGAQGLYGITPDLTTLGKIIGGGMPMGAYGGRREIMEQIAPLGPVYQAGTLSGNPVATAAGIATLKVLKEKENLYPELVERAMLIEDAILTASQQTGIPAVVNRVESMLTVFFTGNPVKDYATAKQSDMEQFARFYREMLSRGIYLPPSQFEVVFVSDAHSSFDVGFTLKAIRESFEAMTRDEEL